MGAGMLYVVTWVFVFFDEFCIIIGTMSLVDWAMRVFHGVVLLFHCAEFIINCSI